MTECTDGCYWELHVLPRRLFQCSNCGEILPLLKAEAVLNEYVALKRENDRMNKQFVHIKAWIQQPDSGITKQQLAAAVVRMCDDALLADTQESKFTGGTTPTYFSKQNKESE